MNVRGFKTKDGSSVIQTGNMVDARIGDLADLTTESKNNLVAAINEAAASGGSGIFYNTIYADFGTMSVTGSDHTFAEMREAIDEGKYVVLVMNGTETHIPLYEYADNEMFFNQSCIQGSETGLFLQVEVSPSEDEGGDDIWSVYTVTVSDTTSKIGDLSNLTTTSKSNLVSAINEVNSNLRIPLYASDEYGGKQFLVDSNTDEPVTYNDFVYSLRAGSLFFVDEFYIYKIDSVERNDGCYAHLFANHRNAIRESVFTIVPESFEIRGVTKTWARLNDEFAYSLDTVEKKSVVNAINELNTKVEQLELRVAALEGNV